MTKVLDLIMDNKLIAAGIAAGTAVVTAGTVVVVKKCGKKKTKKSSHKHHSHKSHKKTEEKNS